MNKRNNWEKTLAYANEELAKQDTKVVITDPAGDGCYRCDIFKNGQKAETYADGFYEEELQDLVSEVWHYAGEKYANTGKKEDSTPITEIRRFLSGLRNHKNSKPYLRVEQIDGYNYLCVYLDNSYTEDEVTSVTDLSSLNGFKKFYQLKMNKVD